MQPAGEAMFERHKDYFIAVCNLCGERSYPIEIVASADRERLEANIKISLAGAGWGIQLAAAYCPGCWPAIRRNQGQLDDHQQRRER